MLLACPNADMTLSEPSMEEERHGWGLEADELRWFTEQWIPDLGGRANPAFSPKPLRYRSRSVAGAVQLPEPPAIS